MKCIYPKNYTKRCTPKNNNERHLTRNWYVTSGCLVNELQRIETFPKPVLRADLLIFFPNVDLIARRFVVFNSCSFSIWKGWEFYQQLTYGVCKQRIIMETGGTYEKSNLYNHFCMEQKSNSERFRTFLWWFRIKNTQFIEYSWTFTFKYHKMSFFQVR